METLPEPGLVGEVPLYLADPVRTVEMAPNGHVLGAITLRGWHLHRIEPIPSDVDGVVPYLVRVHFDFDVAPDVPVPLWSEVEFKFEAQEAHVADAIPNAVASPEAHETYELTRQLKFTRKLGDAASVWPEGSAASVIPLPPQRSAVACSGIGADFVRWRHTGGVPAGAHTACFVLLLPPETEALEVVASGNYHIDVDPTLRLRPAGRPDAFTVRLPPAKISAAPAPLVRSAPVSSPSTVASGARVFISYAQESPEHKADVKSLWSFLEAKDFVVHIDQQNRDVRINWDLWINTQIYRADFVIAVASKSYYDAAHGLLADGERLGVSFEYQRLVDLLHRFRDEWTEKILPVVLPGHSSDEIPLSFLPGTATRYEIEDFTEEGAKSLLRTLRKGRPS